MAQVPNAPYVRSGERDINYPQLASQGISETFSTAAKEAAQMIEKKYQETTDFYDIQKKEADDLNALLDGLDGRDYEEMMKEIVTTRDEFAQMFKGKKLKDYNTPEFQSMLFQKKKRLGDLLNVINTSKNNYKSIMEYAEKTPYSKRGAIRKFVEDEATKSPLERMRNPLQHIQSDPQFYNGDEFLSTFVSKLGTDQDSEIRDTPDATEQIITSWAKGIYDKAGNVIADDATILAMHEADPRFRSWVKNMMRTPENNKLAEDNGFDYTSERQLIDDTKALLNMLPYGKPARTVNKSFKGQTTQKASEGDKKEAARKESIANWQKELLQGGSAKDWMSRTDAKEGNLAELVPIKDSKGRTVAFDEYVWTKRGTRIVKSKEPVRRTPVNPDDIGSVESVYRRYESTKGVEDAIENPNDSVQKPPAY
jgi:hypothetical protein